ncbi:SSI family serine proteinase inhibitor [Frankia sp. Cas3]|uniref:SSI family serine proteinase inhibitor n=1 Tax=Frankia sp. Cas3 TaxID=3073926 RepID=UPI002AD2E235|nr:SSI family serine proteinase inhibitor [Frankia sp. Cas3]
MARRRILARWGTLALAPLLAAGVAAIPASAATTSSAARPTGALILTVAQGEAPYVGATPVTLFCPPNGATTHPNPVAACKAIAAAGGNLDNLAGDPGTLCPEIYMPVTAAADGYWAGRVVHWQKTFSNACFLNVATTPVF